MHLFRLGIVAGLVLVTAGAQAQDLVKIRVGILPVIDFTPVIVAQEKGFFAEEGIEVDTSASGGGSASIPALVGGAYDIVQGNPVSTILAINEDLPVQFAGPVQAMQESPAPSQMVGFANQNYDTAADLEGKSIAVNSRNTVIWLYAREWVRSRGGDPDKVNYREVPFPQMPDALLQGNVDAAFMVQPFKSAAIRDVKFKVIGDVFSEVQPGAVVGNYVTTKQFASDNPELLKKFLRGLRKGIAWYNKNKDTDEGLATVSSLTGMKVETLRQIELPPLPTTIDPAQLQTTAKLMLANGMISAIPDIAAAVNPAALAE
ncbi:ABC transporter substrate-binding protein [Mesorhizobium sp. DCY119]|uniref:ABC transporter substrate-binding protein n=1 Tax=Mesorhizobium sp. DCY119 TaxID=2108445 RepID=UPI000E771D1F|nr:ABC transporter substrate-binding protein [Mesorhizobium sp. DCY119]RJG40604.1 ABC transporter substrate-binding protein [Mesorhizobium sp. DCY119]